MRGKKGFTLIELVLVIALLGILAVSALPNIFNISMTAARTNSRDAVASAVQTGLSLYAANQVSLGSPVSYPSTLDSATAAAAARDNPIFTGVVQGGVGKGWTKADGDCYTADNDSGNYYQYNSTNGTFMHTTTNCGI